MARPRIICHMTSSIDGKLYPSRWTPACAGVDQAVLRAHYDDIAGRLDADGWIVGRTTMTVYASGKQQVPASVTASGDQQIPRRAKMGLRGQRQLAIVVDRFGRLRYDGDDADGDHIVTILGETVSDDYLRALEDSGVSYVFAGSQGDNLVSALTDIGDMFGVETLLLEGGGIINGAFLRSGLIDEISLLVYPGLDGLAGIASIFEADGEPDERPARGKALRHMATETLEGGTVWLRYTVEDAP
jgi:riboflavin biosynthesis pyrimidine reductase